MPDLLFPSIAYPQGSGRTLFTFAAPGSKLSSFLTISRAYRYLEDVVSGYQRAELSHHIGEIRDYLLSDQPMLPNALVVAFDSRVKFIPDKTKANSAAIAGVLHVPESDAENPLSRPGWIVDGQQRMAALRDADLDNFWICVVAFITDCFDEQREQFILVNTTKSLQTSLVYELLPDTNCLLPRRLATRKFPAEVLARLSRESDSPLYKKVRTATFRRGLITDNALLTAIEHSLVDGALYKFRTRNSAIMT